MLHAPAAAEAPPDVAASQDWIDDLSAEELLTAMEAREATLLLRAASAGRLWADRLAAVAGTCLILAGIVFFFAYNWHVMPPFQKFAVIELALILGVSVRVRCGGADLVGKLAALAAAVFVGIFLAVFGQVYQTGADPWLLFAAWALLITPWAAMVRFSGLWALWIVVVDVAAVLYLNETVGGHDLAAQCLGMGLVHAVALALREFAARRDTGAARETWLRQAILVGLLGALTVPACTAVGGDGDGLDLIGLGAWLAATAVVWTHFTRRAPDLFSLVLAALSACVVVLWGIGARILDHAEMIQFFVFGMIVIAVFSAAGYVLRGVMAGMVAQGRDVS